MLLSFITVVYKGVDHLVPGYSYLSWAASRNPDDVNASMHDDNFFYLLCTSMFGGFHIVWMWFSCYLYFVPPKKLHPTPDSPAINKFSIDWSEEDECKWVSIRPVIHAVTGHEYKSTLFSPPLPMVGEKHRGSELSMKADLPAPTTLLSKLFIATGTATESKHNGT